MIKEISSILQRSEEKLAEVEKRGQIQESFFALKKEYETAQEKTGIMVYHYLTSVVLINSEGERNEVIASVVKDFAADREAAVQQIVRIMKKRNASLLDGIKTT